MRISDWSSDVCSSDLHDCVIGDYVTFAPGVRCNGNIRIGDRAYIGSGAVIRQNLTIGADAVVGMGAIVTKDVPPGVRSEEHTSELQSLMRISYAVFCLKKKNQNK